MEEEEELTENYVVSDIKVQIFMGYKLVEDLIYKNEMIMPELCVGEIKHRILNRKLNKEQYDYLETVDFLQNGKLISKNNITISELLKYNNTSSNFEINIYIKTNQMDLVSNKELPVFDWDLQIDPPLQEIYRMTKPKLTSVVNFTVSNSFGQIKFLKPLNLINIKLFDDDIIIKEREIYLSPKINFWLSGKNK